MRVRQTIGIRKGSAHDGSGVGAAFAPGRSERRDGMDKERMRVACRTLNAEREKTERRA